jgi:hypothetical protein
MGQKVPPTSLRLNHLRGFDAAWYSEPRDYAAQFMKDARVRKSVRQFWTSHWTYKASSVKSRHLKLKPHLRLARLITRGLPYKTVALPLLYRMPSAGPQLKFNLLQPSRPKRR